MDYETKPVSRANLRRLAGIMRQFFGIPLGGAFPALEILDRLPELYPGSTYAVVADDELPPKTMAQCTPNNAGGMTVEIKESVYGGAYKHHNGACLGFICHEICHVFLFRIGYTPIYARSFEEGEIPAYRSVEWQAKALCGEVMIPYEESRGMKVKDIQQTYQVSDAFAKYRRKQERKERGNAH